MNTAKMYQYILQAVSSDSNIRFKILIIFNSQKKNYKKNAKYKVSTQDQKKRSNIYINHKVLAITTYYAPNKDIHCLYLGIIFLQ